MQLPHGITSWVGHARSKVSKCLRNICSQKEACHGWNEYLISKLDEIGFKNATFNECVYSFEGVTFILNVDDGILSLNTIIPSTKYVRSQVL